MNWVRHPTQFDYAEQTFADVLADVFRIALERAEDARRMHHAAHHDQLTGLANRRAFCGVEPESRLALHRTVPRVVHRQFHITGFW